MLPPDIEEVVGIWYTIGMGDVFRTLGPTIEKYAEPNAITSLRHWFAITPPPNDPTAVLDAYARRDLCLFHWLEFFQRYVAVIMPTLCDHYGHLNVRHYSALFNDAAWQMMTL